MASGEVALGALNGYTVASREDLLEYSKKALFYAAPEYDRDLGERDESKLAIARGNVITLCGFYDTPFFTREAIHDLDQQLRSASVGTTVYTEGVNGHAVAFTIEAPRPFGIPGEPNLEYIS